MEITVRLLASYRQYLPEESDAQAGYRLTITSGATVGDVLPQLPIPFDDAYTFFVNGRHAEIERILQENDVLSVFPAVGGGI